MKLKGMTMTIRKNYHIFQYCSWQSQNVIWRELRIRGGYKGRVGRSKFKRSFITLSSSYEVLLFHLHSISSASWNERKSRRKCEVWNFLAIKLNFNLNVRQPESRDILFHASHIQIHSLDTNIFIVANYMRNDNHNFVRHWQITL